MVPLGTTHQPPPPATHPRALAPAMPSMGGRGAASRDLTRNPRTAQPEPPRRRSPPSADQGRGASSRYLMTTHTATRHTCPPTEIHQARTTIYRAPTPGTSLPPTPPCGRAPHTHSPLHGHVPASRRTAHPTRVLVVRCVLPGRVSLVVRSWTLAVGRGRPVSAVGHVQARPEPVCTLLRSWGFSRWSGGLPLVDRLVVLASALLGLGVPTRTPLVGRAVRPVWVGGGGLPARSLAAGGPCVDRTRRRRWGHGRAVAPLPANASGRRPACVASGQEGGACV